MVVDVQKSFKKFYSAAYLQAVMDLCKKYPNIYQIWDNHIDKDDDKDYLYHENPEVPIHNDLHTFPNQKLLIEKRYHYDVNVDFFKKVLDKETFQIMKDKESRQALKKGDKFKTKNGTYIVFVGNKHRWFHVPKKLFKVFQMNQGKSIDIIGGSDSECLEDIITSGISLGVNMKRIWKYIYSATHCPI